MIGAGLAWPEVAELDEAVLSARLGGLAAPRTPSRFMAPDYAAVHLALKRKGVTLALLWEEYQAPDPTTAYSYTQFCVRYRDWTGCLKRSMRQVHRAGEKLFVDYAGPTVAIVDIATGEIRNAQIFVAVLGATSYTYAEATWTQALPDWIGAHVRTMAFLGGVVEILVPDNALCGAPHKRLSLTQTRGEAPKNSSMRTWLPSQSGSACVQVASAKV